MSELSYNQKLDLIEQLREALSYDPERRYPEDTVSEIVDSWLPVYYSDIRSEWEAAGCPEPDETMPDNNEQGQMNIHNLMTLGLWEVAHQFASSMIWSDDVGQANDHAVALVYLEQNVRLSHLTPVTT